MTRGQPLVSFSLKSPILSLSLYLSLSLRACISCSTAAWSFAHVPVDFHFQNFPFFFSFSPTPLNLYPCIYRIPISIYFFIHCVCLCLLLFSSCSSVDCVLSSPVHTWGHESQHTNNTYSHTCKYMRSSKAAGERTSPFIYLVKRYYICMHVFPFLCVWKITVPRVPKSRWGVHIRFPKPSFLALK